jgi:sec-independent protein translocase protein TatB
VFDIGFSEIIVCAIVALIVIGPERMPEAVRTMGLWIGRLKRSLRETRVEIERQIGVDDIRRQLHNEDIMRSIEDARKNINDVIQQAQADINAIEHTGTRTYTQEPELPDHAHMDDPTYNSSDANNLAKDSSTHTALENSVHADDVETHAHTSTENKTSP